MKKVFPFLLLFAAVFAVFGVLFLLFRTEALPASVRSFDLRKATGAKPAEPVEEEAV